MKSKIIYLLVFLFAIPLIGLTQDRDLQKLFNQYKNKPGFEFETANPDMDIDGNWDFGEFLDKIEELYILSFDKSKGQLNDLESFNTKFNKLLEKKEFKTMVDIVGDGKVQILLRKDKNDKTRDCIIATEDEDDAAFIWASAG